MLFFVCVWRVRRHRTGQDWCSCSLHRLKLHSHLFLFSPSCFYALLDLLFKSNIIMTDQVWKNTFFISVYVHSYIIYDSFCPPHYLKLNDQPYFNFAVKNARRGSLKRPKERGLETHFFKY